MVITCRFCNADNTVVPASQFADLQEDARGDWDYDDDDEFIPEPGIWWTHIGVCPECQKREKKQAELF